MPGTLCVVMAAPNVVKSNIACHVAGRVVLGNVRDNQKVHKRLASNYLSVHSQGVLILAPFFIHQQGGLNGLNWLLSKTTKTQNSAAL